MEFGVKRLDLLKQALGQLVTGDHRQCRNVIDRLLGIELRALPPGAVQDVDDMALDVEQSEFEYRKQPAWAGANNHRVGGNHLIIHRLAPEIRQNCFSGTRTRKPSRVSETLIWQDNRLEPRT